MKKLVLYSDQEIPENAKVDEKLLALLNKPNPVIGYIPSASDPERKFYELKRGTGHNGSPFRFTLSF